MSRLSPPTVRADESGQDNRIRVQGPCTLEHEECLPGEHENVLTKTDTARTT